MPGVLQGDAPGLGGEARGGRAELVSVAVSPWTRLSRKPEKRVFLSAAWEHLGALSFSVFLGLAGETFSTRNTRATFCFYPGGSLGGRIQRSTRALKICELLGVSSSGWSWATQGDTDPCGPHGFRSFG